VQFGQRVAFILIDVKQKGQSIVDGLTSFFFINLLTALMIKKSTIAIIRKFMIVFINAP